MVVQQLLDHQLLQVQLAKRIIVQLERQELLPGLDSRGERGPGPMEALHRWFDAAGSTPAPILATMTLRQWLWTTSR